MTTKPISLYNTLTRSKSEFVPIEPGKVSLYCCGPTVYNFSHIGNFRTYVFEDVLTRALKRCGYAVTHVMNITDVGHLQSDADEGDDKMMLAVKREQKSPWDIARHYEEIFFKHMDALDIVRPTIVCRATDHIPEMIKMVETLVEKGYGYVSQGNVYFDVTKFDHYCDFAGLRLDQQNQTDRVEEDERKRNQADFALWFSQSKYPNQIMKWDSPWGVGFPGWHIECSAMASRYLGEHFDIHCGGIDHINVHHTNEIAQSECCHGHKWVNVWMHGEFLNLDSGKMSKSKGEIMTVDTLVQNGFDPLDYRYLLFTAHYRSELKFSYETLTSARTALLTLRERIHDWKAEAAPSDDLSDNAKAYQQKFWDAVADDLHMPIAVSVVWSVVKADDISVSEKLALLADFDDVLGLNLIGFEREQMSPEQQALFDLRVKARAEKNWAESDRLRDALLEQGIQVKDSKDGTEWTWAK